MRRSVVVVLTLLLLFGLPPFSGHAQGEIRVLESRAQVDFPQSLTFGLKVESDAHHPIRELHQLLGAYVSQSSYASDPITRF